jgi:hypothetical protein
MRPRRVRGTLSGLRLAGPRQRRWSWWPGQRHGQPGAAQWQPLSLPSPGQLPCHAQERFAAGQRKQRRPRRGRMSSEGGGKGRPGQLNRSRGDSEPSAGRQGPLGRLGDPEVSRTIGVRGVERLSKSVASGRHGLAMAPHCRRRRPDHTLISCLSPMGPARQARWADRFCLPGQPTTLRLTFLALARALPFLPMALGWPTPGPVPLSSATTLPHARPSHQQARWRETPSPTSVAVRLFPDQDASRSSRRSPG